MAKSRPSRSRRSKGHQGKQRRDYETYHSWLGAGAVTISLADSTSDGPPSNDVGNAAAANPASPSTPTDTSPATGSDSDSTTTSPTDKSPTSTGSAQTTTITADVKDDGDKEDLAAAGDQSRVAI